jgi:hypothetical protein
MFDDCRMFEGVDTARSSGFLLGGFITQYHWVFMKSTNVGKTVP